MCEWQKFTQNVVNFSCFILFSKLKIKSFQYSSLIRRSKVFTFAISYTFYEWVCVCGGDKICPSISILSLKLPFKFISTFILILKILYSWLRSIFSSSCVDEEKSTLHGVFIEMEIWLWGRFGWWSFERILMIFLVYFLL